MTRCLYGTLGGVPLPLSLSLFLITEREEEGKQSVAGRERGDEGKKCEGRSRGRETGWDRA